MLFSEGRVFASLIAIVLSVGLPFLSAPASANPDRSGAYDLRPPPAATPSSRFPDLGIVARTTEPFGITTTGVNSGGLLRKWHDVQVGLARESRTLRACHRDASACTAAATQFLALVENGRPLAGLARVAAINRTINDAIRPMTDQAQYGQAELWTTPLVTLSSGAGDCEDYAIAKYAALIELGIPPVDLRLLVVYDTTARENHAVAAVRLGSRWLILDNLAVDAEDAGKRTNLNPLFVLGDQWVHRVDAGSRPAVADAPEFVERFGMSEVPETVSIRFGLIAPLL